MKKQLFSAATFALVLGLLATSSRATNTIQSAAQATAIATTGTQTLLSDDLLPPDNAKALIRFVHAAPNAPAVNILIDNAMLGSDLTFGQAVGYKALPSGAHHIVLQAGGKTIFESDMTFPGKTAFTAIAQGLLDAKDKRAFTVAFYQDDVSETNYRVRLSVIYVTPRDIAANDDGNPVNFVRLDPASNAMMDRLYQNLKYSEITPGFQLDKGNYLFGLQNPSDKKTILDFKLTTDTGMVYTAIVMGYTGDPKVEPKVLVVSTIGLRYYPTAAPSTFAATAAAGGMSSTQVATLSATAQ